MNIGLVINLFFKVTPQSHQWHSHQMEDTLCQAQWMEQSKCGMHRQVLNWVTTRILTRWKAHCVRLRGSHNPSLGCTDECSGGQPSARAHFLSQHVAFSPDGRHIVSDSSDKMGCTDRCPDGQPSGRAHRLSQLSHTLTRWKVHCVMLKGSHNLGLGCTDRCPGG